MFVAIRSKVARNGTSLKRVVVGLKITPIGDLDEIAGIPPTSED
jgi:hypothetical protein